MADVEMTKTPEDTKVVDMEDPQSKPEEIHSRKERITGSTHFGDTDFFDETIEEIGDATWGEVCHACCVHDIGEWGMIFVGLCCLCFCLYFFLFSLELLGTSAKVLGGCAAGKLFGDDTNPIAGLMIGTLATVLLQSSSTTTSIIVSLVGAGSLSVQQSIYMIMGANIGTTVTNTIVAMGQISDGDQFERAFSGATVHDVFNYASVAILLPLEAATGYLYHLTSAMLPAEMNDKGEKWVGPIKKIVSPLGKKVIIANKSLIKKVAGGSGTCEGSYPTVCENGVISYKTCDVGIISCDKSTNTCPAFFQNGATQADDKVSGGVCLFLSLVILVICLLALVTLLQKMLMGTSTRIIYKSTNINPYIAMLIGVGITILVQSSSITTSALTPLVGLGVIQVEQMLPLTLGANIGTTFTALMAAMVSSSVESLQVSLCHFFFNITGILIWFPIPFMRAQIIKGAKILGKMTRVWRGFAVLYLGVAFFLFPLLMLGISSLFTAASKGYTVLGIIVVIMMAAGIAYFAYWWIKRGGQKACLDCLGQRQERTNAVKALPSDMEYLKSELVKLKDHTGFVEEEDEEEAKKLEENSEDTESN